MDPQTQKFVEMQSEIQALREELSRQRTALMSANMHQPNQTEQHQQQQHSNYDEEVKQLESRLQSTQLEVDFFKKLVKEAYSRFKQLNASTNTSPNARKIVDDWLLMFEAVRIFYMMTLLATTKYFT
jgi:chromosome segregation ATPase